MKVSVSYVIILVLFTFQVVIAQNFSLVFDGVDDFAIIDSFDHQSTGSDFTIEFWIKFNAFDGTGNNDKIFDGDFRFWVQHAGTYLDFNFSQTSASISTGQWYHVAATQTNGTGTIYLNGQLYKTGTGFNQLDDNSKLVLGKHVSIDNDYLSAVVDEVRLSNIVRYTSNFTVPQTAFAVDQNTIALWHFNEGSGTTANDETSNNLNWTLNGASWSTDTPPWLNTALNFDRVDDYAIIDSFNHQNTGSDFTIEFWIKFNAFDGTGNNDKIFDGDFRFWVQHAGTYLDFSFSQTSASISTGQWYHVAATQTNGTGTIYLNGQLYKTGTTDNQLDDNSNLILGRHITIANDYLSAVVDEVRLSNIVRYTSNFTVPQAEFAVDQNTIGLWHFNEGTGTTANDETNNNLHWTIFGATYVTSDAPVPVELTSFTASVIDHTVHLKWQTESETNNFGFDVERFLDSDWEKIGFVPGHGTTSNPHHYDFEDDVSNMRSTSFDYRLKQIDLDGAFEYSPVLTVKLTLPETPSLSQNYPNPFNPSTTIFYQLPKSGNVVLSVYNVLGELIETLVDEHQEAGFYNALWNASQMSSGVYFYKLSVNQFTEFRKAIVLR